MQSFNLQIMRIRGIPIILHWTFLAVFLLFSWSLASALQAPWPFGILLYGVLIILVVAHEMAHVLTAARYGYRTRDILLTPLGGLASMERIPEDPRQEAAIAFAGPALNIGLALASWIYIVLEPNVVFLVDPYSFWSIDDVIQNETMFQQGVVWFFKINLALAAFNLLPVFPMDGGRLLRAGLAASGRPYAEATSAAVAVSRVFLVGFALLGFYAPMLWLIAFVLWSAGTNEERSVRTRHGLRHLRAAHLLPQEPLGVEPATRLGELIPALAEGGQRHFPVLDRGRLVGIVGGAELAAALAREGGPDLPATAAMRPAFTVDARDSLADINQRLEERRTPVAVILDDGEIAGLVTAEMLATLADRLGPGADA